MAGLTKAERHNRMMDKVFSAYRENLKNPEIKSYKRHQHKIGVAVKDKGVNYPGPRGGAMTKAISKKMGSKNANAVGKQEMNG